MLMAKKRRCRRCGCKLREGNTANLCAPCVAALTLEQRLAYNRKYKKTKYMQRACRNKP